MVSRYLLIHWYVNGLITRKCDDDRWMDEKECEFESIFGVIE
jgi:hypothetical protein